MKKILVLAILVGLSGCVMPPVDNSHHRGGYGGHYGAPYGGPAHQQPSPYTPSNSASVYNGQQAQTEQLVRLGVVESIREVLIDKGTSGIGGLAGAAVGGVAGSAIGGGKGSVVTSILGAVAGGVIGQTIESNKNKSRGLEITVKLDNGELRAITQEADEVFRIGERVRLLSSGNITRVTH